MSEVKENPFETPKIENENHPLVMGSFSIESPAVFNPEIPKIKIPASSFHFEIPKINPPKIEIPTPKIEIQVNTFPNVGSGEEFSERLKNDERYQKIKEGDGSKNPFGAFSDFVYEKGIDFQTSDFWVDTVDKFTSFSNKVSEWSEGWSDEINKQVTGWEEDLDRKKEGWNEWVNEDSTRAFWLDPIGQRYFNLVDSGAEIYQKFLKATDYTGTVRDIQKLVGKITAGKIERDTSYRNNWEATSRITGKQKLTMSDLLKRKKKEDDENLEDLKKKILNSEDSTEEKKEEENVEEEKKELKKETKSVTPYTPNIEVEGKSLKDILIEQKVKSDLTIAPNLDSSVEKAKLYEFIGEKILSELEAQLDYFIMWFTEGSDLNQLNIPVKSMDNGERKYYYYFYINEISFKPFVKSTMDLKYYPIKTITSNYSKVKNNNEFTIKTSYDIALSFYDFIVDKCMGFNLKEGIIGSRRGNGYNFSRTEGSDFEKSKIDLHVLIPSKSGLNNETKKIVYFANHFILKDIRFSGLDKLSFAHSSTSPFSASIKGVFRKAILIQNEKIGEGTNENARNSNENKDINFGEKVLNKTESKGIQDDKFIQHFFNTTGVNATEGVVESTGLKIDPDALSPVYPTTYRV